MRKLLFALGLTSALVFALAAHAAAPNFAGTWTLDKSKSQGLSQRVQNAESVSWVITQTDKEITIDEKIAGGGGPPSGAPAGGAPAGGGAQAQQRPAGGGPGGGGRPGFNINDMLERLPTISIADVKVGDTIIVSSTQGVDPTRLTAISLVAGADTLLAMLAPRPAAGQAPNPTAGLGGSGISFGIGLP